MAAKYTVIFLENNCSIRVHQSFVANISYYADIMLMLSVTYYAKNNADIIGWSLINR